MKHIENADKPISAILWSPSRRGPARLSARPAQTPLSSVISSPMTLTPLSNQGSSPITGENRHRLGKAASKLPMRDISALPRRRPTAAGTTTCDRVLNAT